MDGKKAGTRFSIQFNRTDPAHLRVSDILNGKERYEKAQYIVDAVLFYESRNGEPSDQRPAPLDEKLVESVVNRILLGREKRGAVVSAAAPAVSVPAGKEEHLPLPDSEIGFEDAVDSLGEDGFNAIAGALDMFRRK